MPYAADLESPKPNSGPRKRSDLWGFRACGNTAFHVRLIDIETVQGDPGRLKRWTAIVRDLLG